MNGSVFSMVRWHGCLTRTDRSASAGLSRAARQPPNAPAIRPPATRDPDRRDDTHRVSGAFSTMSVAPPAHEAAEAGTPAARTGTGDGVPLPPRRPGRRRGRDRRGDDVDHPDADDPSTSPATPPSSPCTTDSPATCPTTRPLDQPMAFSVPNSRVRRETPEIVNSTASASATPSTMIDSQVPRLVMSDDALESEPETVDARSDCELTVASGSAASMSDCTAAIASAVLGLHVDRRDDVLDAGEVLRDIERDVDVRGGVGLSWRSDVTMPTTSMSVPPTSMVSPTARSLRRRVGRVEHGDVLAGVVGVECRGRRSA